MRGVMRWDMSLRPELRALRTLRDDCRQMTVGEFEKYAPVKLMEMLRILDDLTWAENDSGQVPSRVRADRVLTELLPTKI